MFEDVHGGRVEIGIDALDAGLAAVVREGLAPDAEIEPEAARALGRAPEPHGAHGLGATPDPDVTTDDPDAGASEQGRGHRP